jgi:hypothetical protein
MAELVRPLVVAFSIAPSILGDAPVKIAHEASLERQAGVNVGAAAGSRHVAGDHVADMGFREEAVGADGVQPHQHGHQDDQRRPEHRLAAVTAQPGHRGQLAGFERHTHADDGQRGAYEDRRHVGDAEAGGYSGKCESGHQRAHRHAAPTVHRDARLDFAGIFELGNFPSWNRNRHGWRRGLALAPRTPCAQCGGRVLDGGSQFGDIRISHGEHPVVRCGQGRLGVQPPWRPAVIYCELLSVEKGLP